MQADSRTITVHDIISSPMHGDGSHTSKSNGVARPRLFSIDGSHTAEATWGDMVTAGMSIQEGGVIIVDDYFAEGWPGVSEGVQRFMMVCVCV
jgi:hypothetical protein